MKTYKQFNESARNKPQDNPHHKELIKNGYVLTRSTPKLGQAGPTAYYEHEVSGHKIHVEKKGIDWYSLYMYDTNSPWPTLVGSVKKAIAKTKG